MCMCVRACMHPFGFDDVVIYIDCSCADISRTVLLCTCNESCHT